MSAAKKPARHEGLIRVHNFIREHEGVPAAYEWLVATVANQADTIAALRRDVTALKSSLTRLRNEK